MRKQVMFKVILINETQRSGNTYADQDLTGYVLGLGYQHEADAANVDLNY